MCWTLECTTCVPEEYEALFLFSGSVQSDGGHGRNKEGESVIGVV